MVQISLALLRKKAEHNRGDLASLEEVSLHQLDIEGINTRLGNLTKRLRILYLQNNLIPRLQNLHKLRCLEYLNVALNNIRRIEGLGSCEALQKLDLTVNFVGVDALEESIEHLRPLDRLRQLHLTGNPCTDFEAYRDFVVGTLPQLQTLDSQEITRAERILAAQRLPEARRRLREAAAAARAEAKADSEAAAEVDDVFGAGDDDGDSSDDDSAFTPEARLRAFRRAEAKREREEAAEREKKRAEKAESDPWAAAQEELARRVEAPADGSLPRQRNVGRTGFEMREDDPERLVVDVAVPRFLDTSLIEVDVHPEWIQVVFKSNNLLLHLPCEVSPDRSRVQRLPHNGHLLLTMPRTEPVPVVEGRARAEGAPPAGARREPKYAADRGRVRYFDKGDGKAAATATAAAKSAAPRTRGDEHLNEDISQLMAGLGVREISARRSEKLERERAARLEREQRQREGPRAAAAADWDDSEVPPLE